MSDPTLSTTSASLLERIRQSPGDQVAWGKFVGRYGAKIYRWCLRWNLQPTDAEDVTQIVLLKLTEKLQAFSYDPSRSFRAWLKTVTHHAWRDYVDGRNTAGQVSGDIDVLLQNQGVADDLDAYLDDEHQRTLLEEAQSRVQKRVEPATWQAFVLQAIEQQAGREVADRLNMPITAVYMAKSRVQAMLREEVQRLESLDHSSG